MQYKHYKLHWLCVTSIAMWQAIEAEGKRGIKSWKYIKGMEGGGAHCILVRPYFPFQLFPYNIPCHKGKAFTPLNLIQMNKCLWKIEKKHMLSLHRTVDRIFLTQTQKLQLHLLMKHGCIYEVINKLLIDLSIYIEYFKIKDQDITS